MKGADWKCNCSGKEQLSDNVNDDSFVLSLSTAMKVSDIIRQNVLSHQQQYQETVRRQQQQQQQQQFSLNENVSDTTKTNSRTYQYIPGMWQGGVAMIVCGGIMLVPVRTIILRFGQRIGLGTIFPDLVVTPAMAVTTVQIGLYTGSIYGSIEHLQQLVSIPMTASSPTRDAICQNEFMKQLIDMSSKAHTTSKGSMKQSKDNYNSDCDSIDNSSEIEEEGEIMNGIIEHSSENKFDNYETTVVEGDKNLSPRFDNNHKKSTSTTSVWSDPRVETIDLLQQAIATCHERNSYRKKAQM
jgi:hypothetical protein